MRNERGKQKEYKVKDESDLNRAFFGRATIGGAIVITIIILFFVIKTFFF